MDSIRQAIERAKIAAEHQGDAGSKILPKSAKSEADVALNLDLSYLRARRIVAHDGQDVRSRPFDILRTEVLQCMDPKGWKILAVTSPTPGCGKTIVSVNLALSMARQSERQVLLADFDFRKPQIAASLGLKCRGGLLGVVESGSNVDSAVMRVRVGNNVLEVLPTQPAANASELIDSSALVDLLRNVAEYERILILDLPPLLTGHDVISILPQIDCVLIVGAVGVSTTAHIEECDKYLQDTDVIRFVLNKVPESKKEYAYY